MHDIGIKIIEMLNQYVTLNEIILFVLQRSVGFMLVIGASIATERILRNIILDKQIRNLNKALEMSLGIKKQNKFFSRMKGLNLFHKSKSYTQQNTTSFQNDKEWHFKSDNVSKTLEEKDKLFDFTKTVSAEMNLIKVNTYPDCEKDLISLHALAIEYIENISKKGATHQSFDESIYWTRLNDLKKQIAEKIKANDIVKSNIDFINKNVNSQQGHFETMSNAHFSTVTEDFSMAISNTNLEDKGISRSLKPKNN